MKEFVFNDLTLAISKDGRVMQKVPVGLPEWGGFSWVPCKNTAIISEDLDKEQLSFDKFPKIPYDTMLFVREFFSAVYDVHQSEAFVYFSLDRETNQYTVIVPYAQDASAGHVKFDGSVRKYCGTCHVGQPSDDVTECVMCESKDIQRAFIVGSAHSHGAMNAYHSSVDDANELDTTGFHITFGKVNNKEYFEIDPSFVVAGKAAIDGKGTRFKSTNGFKASELIELPFPSRRQQIQRWVSLVTSKPALDKVDSTQMILTRNLEVVSIHGDTEVYTRVAQVLTKLDPTASIRVLSKSDLAEEVALKNRATSTPASQALIGYPSTNVNSSPGGYTRSYPPGNHLYVQKSKARETSQFEKPGTGIKWRKGLTSVDAKGAIKREERLRDDDTALSMCHIYVHMLTSAASQSYDKDVVVRCAIAMCLNRLFELFVSDTASPKSDFIKEVETEFDSWCSELMDTIPVDVTKSNIKRIKNLYVSGSSSVHAKIEEMLDSYNISKRSVETDTDVPMMCLMGMWFVSSLVIHGMDVGSLSPEDALDAVNTNNVFALSIFEIIRDKLTLKTVDAVTTTPAAGV